jgi:hypothetical protein
MLNDPDVQRWAEPVTDRVASNLVSEGEGDEIPSPPDEQSKADQGTPSPIGRDHENFFKRDSCSRGSLQEIPQQEAGSSGAPLRCPVATNKPAVEISTKDRDNQ